VAWISPREAQRADSNPRLPSYYGATPRFVSDLKPGPAVGDRPRPGPRHDWASTFVGSLARKAGTAGAGKAIIACSAAAKGMSLLASPQTFRP
jgi:hypothetical protein